MYSLKQKSERRSGFLEIIAYIRGSNQASSEEIALGYQVWFDGRIQVCYAGDGRWVEENRYMDICTRLGDPVGIILSVCVMRYAFCCD